MPVPKRRHSKGRTRRKRNSHFFRKVVHTVKCKKCGAEKLPHIVCTQCEQ
ncbi:MAG: 50S ribosomal protein L32 [Patescibacteria group bacterium]